MASVLNSLPDIIRNATKTQIDTKLIQQMREPVSQRGISTKRLHSHAILPISFTLLSNGIVGGYEL